MKKIHSILALVVLSFIINSNSIKAQDLIPSKTNYDAKITITPMAGYLLGGSINFIDAVLDISSGGNYGLTIAANTGYNSWVELSYTFMSSDANFRSFRSGIDNQQFDLDVHYIQIGGLYDFLDSDFRPFGLFSIGASGYVPKNNSAINSGNLNSQWFFSVVLGAGIKYMFTPHIGIRIQARLLMPLTFNGYGFYAGTGGVGGGITSTSYLVEGDFMGGLIIGF